ncbi:DNA-directed DNA polymerase epsilon, subunit B [Agyrium rufum]|nr:DNA-directed DNA polymerase epsilon, subunit B [Agyrium rufum]
MTELQTPRNGISKSFFGPNKSIASNPIPSSSPAFATPAHPIRSYNQPPRPLTPTVLPVLLPPAAIRPLAFRVFTKKHNLTLSSPALQALATFVGKHCGSGWREAGLAEKVLEETAKAWKKEGGAVIVEMDSGKLVTILKSLEGCMSGGRVIQSLGLSRQSSLVSRNSSLDEVALNGELVRPDSLGREDSQQSLGLSNLDVGMDEEEDELGNDPRNYLKVVSAFEQPRLTYVASRKHFEKASKPPSLFPDPSHKTQLFRQRYNLIHQRLLRNESFHAPTIAPRAPSLQRSSSTIATTQQAYKLTSIANLLGRGGTSHLILGLLTIAPTGTLALSDLTGSIALDLRHARPIPEDGAWFAPGMIVLVDGLYEDEGASIGATLGGGGGVGGTIGGKFIGVSVGGPPCERREVTLGVNSGATSGDAGTSAGFGWVDFLGVGSERAIGSRMRRLQRTLLPAEEESPRGRMVILGEVNLDDGRSLQALKKVLSIYDGDSCEDSPMTFILIGNFVKTAVMAGGGNGDSIEYKEYFNNLASTMSDFPTILRSSTFVFVPGDNDPWASAFSAGAATVIPRQSVPEVFTSRIKRAFATANAESSRDKTKKGTGEAVWTTNPARLSLFGPVHEVVIFRDDVTGRLHRSAVRFRSQDGEADEASEVEDDAPESMDIDEAVEAAESTIPAPKAKESASSNFSTVSSHVQAARKLVKTVLDQGHLSPFPLTTRPVLWDYAASLQLYPLPTALILADPAAVPFAVTYEGCHVMNPGKLVTEGRRGTARWMEYDAATRKGTSRETLF